MIRALLALALWLLTSPALAAVQNCTFAWNARTDADLAGYKILWGTTSGVYPNIVTLGVVTTTTCAALGMTSAATPATRCTRLGGPNSTSCSRGRLSPRTRSLPCVRPE